MSSLVCEIQKNQIQEAESRRVEYKEYRVESKAGGTGNGETGSQSIQSQKEYGFFFIFIAQCDEQS